MLERHGEIVAAAPPGVEALITGLVDPAEVGEVTAIKAGNQLAVRFRRGIFLFERSQLRLVS